MHTTSVSLLARLREPRGDCAFSFDGAAWERFVSLYTPLMLSWARRVTRQEQDAVDLLQDVFTTLLHKLPQFTYDPNKNFRGWLKTVVINKWRERQRLCKIPIAPDSPDQLDKLVSPAQAEAFWDKEYHQRLVDRSLTIMQQDFAPKTWKACWELVVNGRSAPEIAKELGMTAGGVYAAKLRVLARLREELREFID